MSSERINKHHSPKEKPDGPGAQILLAKSGMKPNDAYQASQGIMKEANEIVKIDMGENAISDQGVMYLCPSIKACKYLKELNLSSNSITEYGVRLVLENIHSGFLKYLNLSHNVLGSKGAEHVATFLSTRHVDHLNLNWTSLDDEGGRNIGIVLSNKNTVRVIELINNGIKGPGAVMIGRSLANNNSVEEINMANNAIGAEGAVAFADCIKANRTLAAIDLSGCSLALEGVKAIAQALKTNSVLKYINLGDNNIAPAGVYEIFRALSSEESAVEVLCLKNTPIQKYLSLMIEMIQFRRKFKCEHGTVHTEHDNSLYYAKIAPDEDGMLRLYRYLSEKRLKLIDLLFLMNRNNTAEISADEFQRRLKIFEPRLAPKDLKAIASYLSKNGRIHYGLTQRQHGSNRVHDSNELGRIKSRIDADEDKALGLSPSLLNRVKLTNNINGSLQQQRQNHHHKQQQQQHRKESPGAAKETLDDEMSFATASESMESIHEPRRMSPPQDNEPKQQQQQQHYQPKFDSAASSVGDVGHLPDVFKRLSGLPGGLASGTSTKDATSNGADKETKVVVIESDGK